MDFTTLEKKISELVARCEGRVGIVIETEEGTIRVNHEEIFSSASLIKVPILIEGFRQSEEGMLDLYEYVKVHQTERVEGAGVIQALSIDIQLKVIDLLTLMIIVSDNIATNILIEFLGIDKINNCMKWLGMKNSELNRKMMDFEALKNGIDNRTTASDMVACIKAMDEGSFLSKENSAQALQIMEKQQFINKLAAAFDFGVVANKTGELPGVEHDCAIIRHNDKKVYAAVLINELTDQETGRQTLFNAGKLIAEYMK